MKKQKKFSEAKQAKLGKLAAIKPSKRTAKQQKELESLKGKARRRGFTTEDIKAWTIEEQEAKRLVTKPKPPKAYSPPPPKVRIRKTEGKAARARKVLAWLAPKMGVTLATPYTVGSSPSGASGFARARNAIECFSVMALTLVECDSDLVTIFNNDVAEDMEAGCHAVFTLDLWGDSSGDEYIEESEDEIGEGCVCDTMLLLGTIPASVDGLSHSAEVFVNVINAWIRDIQKPSNKFIVSGRLLTLKAASILIYYRPKNKKYTRKAKHTK